MRFGDTYLIEDVWDEVKKVFAKEFVQGPSVVVGDRGHIEWNDRGANKGEFFRKPK